MIEGGWGVLVGTQEEVWDVDNTISLGDCGLGEVVVEELGGVRVMQRLGHSIHHTEAAVVVEAGPMLKPLQPQKSQVVWHSGLLKMTMW